MSMVRHRSRTSTRHRIVKEIWRSRVGYRSFVPYRLGGEGGRHLSRASHHDANHHLNQYVDYRHLIQIVTYSHKESCQWLDISTHRYTIKKNKGKFEGQREGHRSLPSHHHVIHCYHEVARRSRFWMFA